MIATHLFVCFSSSLRKSSSLAFGSCFITRFYLRSTRHEPKYNRPRSVPFPSNSCLPHGRASDTVRRRSKDWGLGSGLLLRFFAVKKVVGCFSIATRRIANSRPEPQVFSEVSTGSGCDRVGTQAYSPPSTRDACVPTG